MSIDKFCKRMKDENLGPKDHMIILNIGEGCIHRYVGPCTLAHAEYIKSKLDYRQEVKTEDNEHYIKTIATIIKLERPRYACDPITEYYDVVVYKESDLN